MAQASEYKIEVRVSTYMDSNNHKVISEITLDDPKKPTRKVLPYAACALPIPDSIVNRIRADVLEEVTQ